MNEFRSIIAGALGVLFALSPLNLAAAQGTTELVSVDSFGVQGDDSSMKPSISGDGRFVAFSSAADNLVPGTPNSRQTLDVFVHDRQTGLTERVSVDSSGGHVLGTSDQADISADGRFVAFRSVATTLVSGDGNGLADIFVHDRQTGVTERVNVGGSGAEANHVSSHPSISAHGRFVAFDSRASNLVLGDSNGTWDIFVYDRQTGLTERVSVDSSGVQGNGFSARPSISEDGRFVAFDSGARNLDPPDSNGRFSDIFVHDRQTGVTEIVSINNAGEQARGSSSEPSISADGQIVAFFASGDFLLPGDSNGQFDILVRDRGAGVTNLVSVDSAGGQGNGHSFDASVSADGRFVAFWSFADNLVAGDTNGGRDVFVHDRQTGITERVSVADPGATGSDGQSADTTISADGRFVAFISTASNLVVGDNGLFTDIFVRDRGPFNQPPVADAGGPYAVNEGASVMVTATGSDPDGDPLTYAWDLDNDGVFETPGQAVSFSAGALDGPSVASISVQVSDPTGDTDVASTTVDVFNVAPTVTTISASLDPVSIGTSVPVSGTFSDPAAADTHTAEWDWGDGSTNDSEGVISGGSVTGDHAYTDPGIYRVALAVIDDDGGVGSLGFEFIVVFDPEGGFVTGGGIIDSPPGAYALGPAVGTANFGFFSKFKKGATVPIGSTEFQFQAAGLNFHSNLYQWLVVAGARAQFKGEGTLNGVGGYDFQVTAIDGQEDGGGGVDRFRIKIKNGGGVVYDNQAGDADDADPTTAIKNGSIVIHHAGKKGS